MRTLADLEKDIDSKIKKIKTSANDAKKAVARTIINDLIYVTPVDTSKALSNWRINKMGPEAPIGPHYPGEAGSTQGSSASAAISAAEAIIRDVKPGEPLVIFNSLPYIQRLNEGSSAQAPAGFVERALLLGKKTLRNFKFRWK